MIRGTSEMDVARRPASRTRRGARAAGGLLACGALGALAWPWLSPSVERWVRAGESVAAGRVRLARVARGDLVRDVSVEGRVVAAYHPTLYSSVLGIVSLEVREGEAVHAGDVLARIESPELRNRREQEESTLLAMRSDLERAKIRAREENLTNRQDVDLLTVKLAAAGRAVARAEESLAAGLINDIEHEQALDDHEIARLELEHARQKASLREESLAFEVRDKELQVSRQELVLAEVDRRLAELEIRAPFDGLAASIAVEDRDAVQPSQPLLTVVDLSTFEIEARVPEAYADDVAAGTRAEVLVDGTRERATVVRVSPEVSGTQVPATLSFDGEAPEGLRQSQRVTVRLLLEERPNVLRVARGPFLEAGGGRFVYRLEDGLLVRTPVSIGAVSVTAVEILEGLAEGDTIVLSDMSLYGDAETLLYVEP